MNQDLFLKTALQKLSAPEQLDQALRITRPRAWIALTGICVLLAGVLAWSILGRISSTVDGRGILLREGGGVYVVAFSSGVVSEIAPLAVGQRVQKGQLLGRIAQPELDVRITAKESEVSLRLSDERAAVAAAGALAQAQADEERGQQAALEKILAARQEQLGRLRGPAGAATPPRWREILALEEEIAQSQAALRHLPVRKMEQEMQREQRLGAVRAARLQAQAELDELMLQRHLASDIVSTHDGRIVELMAMEGDVIRSGQIILNLEIDVPTMEAVIYLPHDSSPGLLKPGMEARISPVTAKKERYGYLLGKVREVAPYPATEQGMQSALGNPGLVRELSRDGPPTLVEVDLLPDPDSKSGYRWSSRAGAALELASGTMANASFVIERQRPISFLLPLARESAGL